MAEEPPGRRRSDLLDSILDTVEGTPERGSAADSLFRTQALEQLDVATEVDSQLPLVSRRSWLLVAGLVVVALAFLAWAALTPSVESVRTSGRMVAPPGLIPVVAPEAGVLASMDAKPGETMAAGQAVGVLRTPAGDVPLSSIAPGEVWQVLLSTGEVAAPGESVMTLLPPNSDTSLLAVVPEMQSLSIRPGMEADTGAGIPGRVISVSAPIPGASVAERTGIVPTKPGNYAIIAIEVDEPLPAGSLVPTTVILSKSTVLGRALGSN